ncbi:MAG: hypothetical protein H6760_02175 [Candidatus Nomurabacteria bacterium]|nr:MAG: hypothetical protein H6760_02175 [Candidatus Nomurabacteria bacterium]
MNTYLREITVHALLIFIASCIVGLFWLKITESIIFGLGITGVLFIPGAIWLEIITQGQLHSFVRLLLRVLLSAILVGVTLLALNRLGIAFSQTVVLLSLSILSGIGILILVLQHRSKKT